MITAHCICYKKAGYEPFFLYSMYFIFYMRLSFSCIHNEGSCFVVKIFYKNDDCALEVLMKFWSLKGMKKEIPMSSKGQKEVITRFKLKGSFVRSDRMEKLFDLILADVNSTFQEQMNSSAVSR